MVPRVVSGLFSNWLSISVLRSTRSSTVSGTACLRRRKSRNTISSYVDTNTPALGVATAPAASKWNFAWALHTGLAYRVNPGFTVEFGYSYVNLGDATTGIVSDFTGFANNHTMGFKDITSHDLTLGVRWNLDSPVVYAPPPVVHKG